MREILFRAWDDVKGKMYHAGEESDVVFELTGVGIEATDITEGEEEFRTLHHLKYMQYTGLKDKNGIEIYEGDIGYTVIDRYSEHKQPFLAVVRRDRCFWDFYEEERQTPHEIWPKDQFEIIGNIYEHPHLLEGRDEA
ncbi:YopX family protein [Paenibacillus sp. FSL P4-0176]|uniref:YopX family protein n=1 Tax=Paenibacillus sp. FSL P4-0176 TaxID=2921631 RepID=UPI0030D2D395